MQKFWSFFHKPNCPEIPPQEPFIQIPCQNCNAEIIIEETVHPGDVAVTNCDNCSVQWTIYCPPLVVRKTEDIPKEIQSQVWGKMSGNG